MCGLIANLCRIDFCRLILRLISGKSLCSTNPSRASSVCASATTTFLHFLRSVNGSIRLVWHIKFISCVNLVTENMTGSTTNSYDQAVCSDSHGPKVWSFDKFPTMSSSLVNPLQNETSLRLVCWKFVIQHHLLPKNIDLILGAFIRVKADIYNEVKTLNERCLLYAWKQKTLSTVALRLFTFC